MALHVERSVVVPGVAPEIVFPYLIEPDKVPQWMSDLDRYEAAAPGPLALGSRIHQELTVSGQKLRFELEVTALEPPRSAELRFEGSGFKAANQYSVEPDGGGTKVTWTMHGDATSFSARIQMPVGQGKLQQKLETDLERLRALLS